MKKILIAGFWFLSIGMYAQETLGTAEDNKSYGSGAFEISDSIEFVLKDKLTYIAVGLADADSAQVILDEWTLLDGNVSEGFYLRQDEVETFSWGDYRQKFYCKVYVYGGKVSIAAKRK